MKNKSPLWFFCLRFLFFSITQTQKLSESTCRRTRKEILFFLRLNKKRRENIFSQHTATQNSIVRLIVRKVNKFTELYSLFFSSTGNTPGSLWSINLVHCRGSLRREIIVGASSSRHCGCRNGALDFLPARWRCGGQKQPQYIFRTRWALCGWRNVKRDVSRPSLFRAEFIAPGEHQQPFSVFKRPSLIHALLTSRCFCEPLSVKWGHCMWKD